MGATRSSDLHQATTRGVLVRQRKKKRVCVRTAVCQAGTLVIQSANISEDQLVSTLKFI